MNQGPDLAQVCLNSKPVISPGGHTAISHGSPAQVGWEARCSVIRNDLKGGSGCFSARPEGGTGGIQMGNSSWAPQNLGHKLQVTVSLCFVWNNFSRSQPKEDESKRKQLGPRVPHQFAHQVKIIIVKILNNITNRNLPSVTSSCLVHFLIDIPWKEFQCFGLTKWEEGLFPASFLLPVQKPRSSAVG